MLNNLPLLLVSPILLLGAYTLAGAVIVFIPFHFVRPFIVYFWARKHGLKFVYRKKWTDYEQNFVEGVYQGHQISIHDEYWGPSRGYGSRGTSYPNSLYTEKLLQLLWGWRGYTVKKSPLLTIMHIDGHEMTLRSERTFLGFYLFPSWHGEVLPELNKLATK